MYVSVRIESSTTDVCRRDNDVFIARTDKSICPVYWTKLYLQLANLSNKPDNFICSFHTVFEIAKMS